MKSNTWKLKSLSGRWWVYRVRAWERRKTDGKIKIDVVEDKEVREAQDCHFAETWSHRIHPSPNCVTCLLIYQLFSISYFPTIPIICTGWSLQSSSPHCNNGSQKNDTGYVGVAGGASNVDHKQLAFRHQLSLVDPNQAMLHELMKPSPMRGESSSKISRAVQLWSSQFIEKKWHEYPPVSNQETKPSKGWKAWHRTTTAA